MVTTQTIARSEGRGQIQDAITDTKTAVVLATLGLKLVPRELGGGIYVQYDEAHPKSTGGLANFIFLSDTDNVVARYERTYQEGTADVELDAMLDVMKAHPSPEVRAAVTELEGAFVKAAVVLGRRFLENYQRMVHFLKEEAPELLIIGGRIQEDPQSGRSTLQGFRFKYIPRDKKKGAA